MGRNVHSGISLDLSGMSDRDKSKLIRLMARIMEDSYRRGAQQMEYFCRQGYEFCDLVDLRHFASLDVSPDVEDGKTKGADKSVDRLDMEYGYSLLKVGIDTLSLKERSK